MLVVGFLGVETGGWLWPPPVFSLVRLLTAIEIELSTPGSGTLILFTLFLLLIVNTVIHSHCGAISSCQLWSNTLLIFLFEQIIVFQAGVRRNTLAWNKSFGPCVRAQVRISLFVGFFLRTRND